MTCILVAHLGEHVILAADKRAVQINADGSRAVLNDDVEKIVETGVGVITGAGIVEMLDEVKSKFGGKNFNDSGEVLESILQVRKDYSERYSGSSRLDKDLRETSWVFTYPATEQGKAVTRVRFYHQSVSADSLVVLGEYGVLCLPGGLSSMEAQAVQSSLQEVVRTSLGSLPYEQAAQAVFSYMIQLMSDVSEVSVSVSSRCDVALISGSSVEVEIGFQTHPGIRP